MIPAHVKTLLQDIYGQRWGEAYIEWGLFNATGSLDPATRGFGRAATASPPDNMAVFHSAGLLKPGTLRADVNVEKLMTFVMDDVGTVPGKGRIDPDMLEMRMPEPTEKVHSSPGNYQWQWGITDGMDEATMTALRRSLPWQSHATAMSNLIRLSMGISGKPGITHTVTGTRGPVYTCAEFIRLCGGLLVPVTPLSQGSDGDLIEDPALLSELVDLIPNDVRDWDRFVNVGRAIWGASGGAAEADFHRWAEKFPGSDAAVTQGRWDSYRDAHIGRFWLLREAQKADPAAVDAWMRKETAAVFNDNPEPPPVEPPITFGDEGAFKLEDPKKFPRRPWLYGNRLMRGYLSSTVAAGGLGKSSLVMTEIIAMTTGRELIGHKPRLPLRVWLWNGEDDLIELKRRIHGIAIKYGVNDADLGSRLFIDSGRDKPIVIAASDKGGAIVNTRMVEAIKANIKARKIDVLVLDPFVSTHKVSENDNMAVDLVAKTLSRIADECHCAIDLVHHTRKPGGGDKGGSTVDDARGASALVNATRHARIIEPMPASVAAKMGITNHRAYFAIQHNATKANMVPPGIGADWYKFESVGLGNEDPFPADGGPSIDEDKVGVIVKFVPPAQNVTQDPNVVKAAQDIIAKGRYRSHPTAQGWVGPVIAGALGVDISEAGGRALVLETIKDWLAKDWIRIEPLDDGSRHKTPHIVVGGSPLEEF